MSDKPSECCELMTLVLSRRRESDRIGLMAETMYSLRGTSPIRETIVIRFHKSKNRGEPFADSTYSEVAFCPFCGTKQAKGEQDVQQDAEGSSV
jgi:hypothetical protein